MTKLADFNLLSFGNTIQLAGAVFAGESKVLMVMFPGEGETAESPIELHPSSDEWKELLRQTDLLETEILAKAADGTITKAIVRKSQRQIDAVLSWAVFKRDGYRCRYCGRDDVPLTVDHIICWEAFGESSEENLISSCKKCNKIRGNLPYEDWLKHPYYQAKSAALTEQTRLQNAAILDRLDKIRRVAVKRSR